MVQSAQTRTNLFGWTLSHCSYTSVLGRGVGQWGVDFFGADERGYPHNILLELMYEQGIVGLVMGIAIFWLILNGWRQASSMVVDYELNIELFTMTHIAGLLFFYSLIQAMKSGDLIDSRPLFFCAGLVVAIFNVVRAEKEEVLSYQTYYPEGGQWPEESGFEASNEIICENGDA